MKVFAALVLLAAGILQAGPVKVACVGDSITRGVGVRDSARESYPAVLGRLLGHGYDVRNFGFSGATLLRRGNNPYEKTPAFRDARRFKPDIVVIALGTNDSKTRNWDGREKEFRPDYEAFIAQFSKLSRQTKVFACLPPPSFQARGDDIREPILQRQRRLIAELARAKDARVIDLYSPLKAHRRWLPDGVHPNADGARAIAQTVAHALRN